MNNQVNTLEERETKLHRLVCLLMPDEMVNKLFAVVLSSIVESRSDSPEEMEENKELLAYIIDRMRTSNMSSDIRYAYAELTAGYYNDEEVDQLLAFYSTPLGKKVIASGCEIASKFQATISSLSCAYAETWIKEYNEVDRRK